MKQFNDLIFRFTVAMTTVSTALYYYNGCECDNTNSLYLLPSGLIPTSITSAFISAIITVVVLRLFCELKCRRTKKTSSPHNSSHFRDNSSPNVPGPLYEEVDLSNKDFTLNFFPECSLSVYFKQIMFKTTYFYSSVKVLQQV